MLDVAFKERVLIKAGAPPPSPHEGQLNTFLPHIMTPFSNSSFLAPLSPAAIFPQFSWGDAKKPDNLGACRLRENSAEAEGGLGLNPSTSEEF